MGVTELDVSKDSGVTTVPSRVFKKGFFLHPREKLAARGVVVALLLVFVVHIIYLTLYFGALWNIEQGFSKLPTALVNADQGLAGHNVGALIFEGVMNVANPYKPGAPLLDWQLVNETPSFEDLQNQVDNQDYWFAVYIPPDFTQNLIYALLLNEPYTNNISLIYDEGRQYTTILTGRTMVTTVMTGVSYQLSTDILGGKLGIPYNLSAIDLVAVVNPVRVSLVNLHPAHSIGPAFSTYMGFFVSWLTAVLVVNIMRRSLEPIERAGTPFWTDKSRAVLKGGIAFFASLIIGLLQSAITTGFGLTFTMGFANHFGICALSSLTFMAVVASIINLLGDAGLMLMTILLYLQIGNSSSIYSNELMNSFYTALGPVFPIYHSVQALRTVSFGSANNIGLNVGVLFVWLFVCASTSYLAVHYDVSKKLSDKLRKRAPNLENAVLAATNHKIERLPTQMIKLEGAEDEDEDEDEETGGAANGENSIAANGGESEAE